MRNKVIISLVGMTLLVALAVIGLSSISSSHAAPSLPPPTGIHATQKVIPASQVGVDMIPAPPAGKSLTIAQVQAFVEAQHRFAGGDVVGGGTPSVVASQEMTLAQYESTFHVNLSKALPTTEQVIVVRLSGPFHITNENVPPGAEAAFAQMQAKMATEVFDASTGNLLEWNL